MSITVGGKEFKTLDDNFYVNGSKVMAAYVDGVQVYPDDSERPYKYNASGTGLASKVFVYTYTDASGVSHTDTITVNATAFLNVKSDIPMQILDGRLVFQPGWARDGYEAVITVSTILTASGGQIPAPEQAYFNYYDVRPRKPDDIFRNPRSTVGGSGLISVVELVSDSDAYGGIRIVSQVPPLWPQTTPIGVYMAAKGWGNPDPGSALRGVYVDFTYCSYDETRATPDSIRESQKSWGYDSTMWIYETHLQTTYAPTLNIEHGAGTTFYMEIDFDNVSLSGPGE